MTNREIIEITGFYQKEIAKLKEQVKQYRSFFNALQSNLKFILLACNACIEVYQSESDGKSKN